MKVVFFNEEDMITDIFPDIDQSLVIKDSDISWKDGEVRGILSQYCVLPDEVELDLSNIGQIISQAIKEQDQSANYIYFNEQERQAQSMQLLINEMLLDPTDFEQSQQIQQTQQMLNNFMLGGL